MRTCSRDGCERRHHAQGLCKAHYSRVVRGRDKKPKVPPPIRLCSVEGCDRKHKARGLCDAHYLRWREGRIMHDLIVTGKRGRDQETDPRNMSGQARAEFGVLVSFENDAGQTLVLHRIGATGAAIRAACETALALDETFRVVSCSTPATVYSDMLQRLPNRRMGRQGFVQLPEVQMLAAAKMSHMLHPSLDRKNRAVFVDDDTWEPRTFA